MVLAYHIDTTTKLKQIAAIDHMPKIEEDFLEKTGEKLQACSVRKVNGRIIIEEYIVKKSLLFKPFFITVRKSP